jgi:hypothetical protein
MPSIKCRHCPEYFTPTPGKPGLIDECPKCWADKNPPLPPPKKSPYKSVEEQEGKRKHEVAKLVSGEQLLRRSDLTQEQRRRIELMGKASLGRATQAEIEELRKILLPEGQDRE